MELLPFDKKQKRKKERKKEKKRNCDQVLKRAGTIGHDVPKEKKKKKKRKGKRNVAPLTRKWSRSSGLVLRRRITFLLVDLDVVDKPVRLSEVSGIGSNVFLASRRQRRTLRVAIPDATGPFSTEGSIEDDVEITEAVVNVTSGATVELGHRCSPRGRVRCTGGDVTGDGVTSEEPNGDVIRGPFSSVDTSTDGIKAISVGVGVGGLLRTASVSVPRVAVTVEEGSSLRGACVVNGTASRSVESNRVCLLVVHSLEDVDLTSVGPFGTKHPECRPDTTGASRHVRNVGNEEAMVESSAGSDTNGSSAGLWVHGVVVNAHVNALVGKSGKLVLIGNLRVDVLHESFGRVRSVKERELAEEIAAVVLDIQVVSLGVAHACAGQENGAVAQDVIERRHLG
jgi:hypothetical protein